MRNKTKENNYGQLNEISIVRFLCFSLHVTSGMCEITITWGETFVLLKEKNQINKLDFSYVLVQNEPYEPARTLPSLQRVLRFSPFG